MRGAPIRFVPYPVIGGFLGATGWLLVTGAVQVATDQHPTFANVGTFIDTAVAAKVAAGSTVALTLYVLLHRFRTIRHTSGTIERVHHHAFRLIVDGDEHWRGASSRLDVPAANGGRVDIAMAGRVAAQLSVVVITFAVRRCAGSHFRHRNELSPQYDGDRDCESNRGQRRARSQGAWGRQSRDRRARRLCELHIV